MTSQRLAEWRRGRTLKMPMQVRDDAMTIGVYLILYIALDWISFVQVLPNVGFNLWNPPPAASVALLLIKGLRFAPLVLVTGVISDGLVAGFPLGLSQSFATSAIVAAGYAGVAVALRRCANGDRGLLGVNDVAWLLLVTAAGAAAITAAVALALTLMGELPRDLLFLSARHFFIGDLTGIIGLLPVLMTAKASWTRWQDASTLTRALDLGGFALGAGLALLLVFGIERSSGQEFFYFLLPPIIWIGARAGIPWCAAAILVEQLSLVMIVTWLGYSIDEVVGFQILTLVIGATGLILGAVVSERQQAERSLREQQAALARTSRLTTVGALGAAVVHEISQPLAAIATLIYSCRGLLMSGTAELVLVRQTMTTVEAEVRRAGEIVERLRDFLGSSSLRLQPVDIVELTRKIVAALADESSRCGVTVRIEADALPAIAADRVQMEQVLVNLLRNAIEAVNSCRDRKRLVRIRLRRQGAELQVDLEDNGPGVAREVAEHLFEPLETSKTYGVGLGLWLSREIVTAHKGRLWWDETFHSGARFVVRIPFVQAERP